MSEFTQKQVETMCVGVGFVQAIARIASAIAMVESPGKTIGTAESFSVGDQELADDTWGYSYGLFQIRSLKVQYKTGKTRDANELYDPIFNCKSAYTIWGQSNFNPWATYTSGAYKAYLQDIFPPVPGTYTVVGGDSLVKIGIKVGVAWQELARINNMHPPYLIVIGQSLRLPFDTYRVVLGDSLSKIATKIAGVYGKNVTWQAIAKANNILSPYTIQPGQKLKIPISI